MAQGKAELRARSRLPAFPAGALHCPSDHSLWRPRTSWRTFFPRTPTSSTGWGLPPRPSPHFSVVNPGLDFATADLPPWPLNPAVCQETACQCLSFHCSKDNGDEIWQSEGTVQACQVWVSVKTEGPPDQIDRAV